VPTWDQALGTVPSARNTTTVRIAISLHAEAEHDPVGGDVPQR
jgi:hypothetical protein